MPYSIRLPDGTLVENIPDDLNPSEAKRRIIAAYPQFAPETTFGGQVKEAFKGLVPGAVGLLETAGAGAAAVLPEEYERGTRQRIEELATAAKKPFEAAPGYEETVGRKLGEAIGSTVPFIAAAPFGLPGAAAAVGLGVGAGAGEARTRAEREGATAEERAAATALGTIPGAAEAFAPIRILGRLGNEIVGGGVTYVKRALAAGGEEAAQEAASAFAQNLIAKGIYKPEQELIEGLGEQAAYGGATGAIVQGLLDLAIGRRARGPAAPAAPTEPTAPAAPADVFQMTPVDRAREMAGLLQAEQTPEVQARLAELREADLQQVEQDLARIKGTEPTTLEEQIKTQIPTQMAIREAGVEEAGFIPGDEFAGPVPEAEFPTILTSDVLDRTGLSRQSSFFKELEGKDLTNRDDQIAVGETLAKVRVNPNIAESTKAGLENVAMQGFGAAAEQQELFVTRGKRKGEPTAAALRTGEESAAVEPVAGGRLITEEDFKQLGIGPSNKKLREELIGKDLADPAQAAVVKNTLETYASAPNRSPKIASNVESFLGQPIFKGAEDVEPAKPPTPVTRAGKPSVPVPSKRGARPTPGVAAPDMGPMATVSEGARLTPTREAPKPSALDPATRRGLDKFAEMIRKEPGAIDLNRRLVNLPTDQQAYVRAQLAPAFKPKFRGTPKGTKGNPKDVVEKLVTRMMTGWVNAPKTQVVQSITELPDYMQAEIREARVNPKGAFDPRTESVFIVADNIVGYNDLVITVAHEAIGHYGLRSVLGGNYSRVLNGLYRTNDQVRAKADIKIKDGLDRETAIEEVLAEAVEEKVPADTMMGKALQVLRNAIRQAMRAFGVSTLNDRDVQDLLDSFSNYVVEGKGVRAEGVAGPQAGVFKKAPTLTAAGQQAQQIVNRMKGISNEKPKVPEKSTVQKVGAFFFDPSYRQDQIDRIRVQVAYKGASVERKLMDAFNGKLRDALGNIRPDVFMTAAEHSDTMTVAAMKQGTLFLNKNIGWDVKEGPNSLQGAMDTVRKLGDKLGSQELAFKLANDAFIARRANTLKNHPEKDVFALPSQDKIDAGLQAFRDFPELEQAFKEYTGFKNGLIDAMVEGGRLSKEQAQTWKDAIDYVPWNRIKEYEEKTQTSPKGYFKGLTNLGQMGKLTGSQDEINNVFDNMVGLSFWMTNSAIRNHAALNLVDTFDRLNLGVRRVQEGQSGVDPNRTIYIYRDGKPESYELDSIADVYAFKGVESMSMPMLKSLASFANFLRKATTATPQFAVSQLFQDSYRATVMSGTKSPFRTASNVLRGYISSYFGDPTTQRLEQLGIVGMYDLMPGRVKEDIEKEFGLKQRTAFEKTMNFMESFSIASDAALRKSIFERTLAETKSDQFPEGDVLLARYRAQEVINFKRQGANRLVGLFRQVIPFMNAYIQGMDVFYRSMTGRGIAAEERSAAAALFWRTGAKLATLSLVYAFMVGDDEEYEGLRDFEKDKNFIVPFLGVKIPVAPEVGFLFKVLPERIYNYISSQGTESPQDATALRKALATAGFDAITGPNLTPQFIKPIIEANLNFSFFTNTPIVGRGLEQREASQQFTSNTAELAKMFGELTGLSPMKLEYVFRGYTGIAGGTLLDLTNMMFANRPERHVYELPGFKTFMYDKIPGGYKEQYYDLRDRVTEVNATINGFIADGRVDELMPYLTEEKLNRYALMQTINEIDQTMEDFRAMRKLVAGDKTMSGEEKRKIIDDIDKTENDLLKFYNVLAMRKKIAGL